MNKTELNKNEEKAPELKKKPVVEILMSEKESVYASECMTYCGDQC